MADATSTVQAFVAVGSNIHPERNILEAVALLAEAVHVASTSTFYRSPPVERPEQPDFRNGVIEIRTSRSPRPLKFDVLRSIEDRLGRVRTRDPHAARIIDLDLILFGRLVLEDPDLRLPDPDIRVRPFVAVPLLELEPHCTLPDTGEALSELPAAQARLRPDNRLTELLKARLTP